MKFILVLLLLPFVLCCANEKKVNTSAAQNTSVKTMNDTIAITVNDTLPLIVQFYSIGEGINANSKTLLDKFISDQQKKMMKTISYQSIHWGREGEFDACFRLANLNDAQRHSFIAELKKMYDDKSLVHILENQNCRYIR